MIKLISINSIMSYPPDVQDEFDGGTPKKAVQTYTDNTRNKFASSHLAFLNAQLGVSVLAPRHSQEWCRATLFAVPPVAAVVLVGFYLPCAL
jgi:hypothetical protein